MGLQIFYKPTLDVRRTSSVVNREVEASDYFIGFSIRLCSLFVRKDLSQPELFSLFCMEKKTNKQTWLPSLYYRER